MLLAAGLCLVFYGSYLRLINHQAIWFQRILPKKPSQNITATFKPFHEPQRTIYVCTHLDSPRTFPRFASAIEQILKRGVWLEAYIWVILSGLYFMTSVTRNLIPFYAALLFTLWPIGSFLLHLFQELFGDATLGIDDNASGIAGLLHLGKYLKDQPLDETEVKFVFLGSHHSGAFGAQKYWLDHQESLRRSPIIGFSCVGKGNSSYVLSEGFVEHLPCSSRLSRLIDEYKHENPTTRFLPFSLFRTGQFTNCTYLLHRGCQGISLMAFKDDDLNRHDQQDCMEEFNHRTFFTMYDLLKDLIYRADREITKRQKIQSG